MINRVAPVQARQRRLTFDSMGRSAGVIVLVAATVYTLAPIWWLVVASTKDNADLLGTNGFLFADFNLVSNLVALNTEQGGIFWRWIANTAFYAGIGAVLSTLIAFLAGHAFEKFNFRGKETLFGVVLLGVLLPSAVTAMPLYLLASQLGLVNTYWGVFLPLLVNPFGVYLARIMSRSYVPEEVLEAARIDGAGEIRSFFTVALPMMIPAFVTVLLITFNSIWNNFFLPLLMLSNPELYPVSLGIYYWNSLTGADSTMYHLVIIASAVAVIPVIAIFLMLQRYWRSGLGDGAIK